MNMSDAIPPAAVPPASDNLRVRKELFVRATPARAFEVFTAQMGSWWPLATHHIGKADAKTAIVEPFVGGRWFEQGVDGSECDWGKVLAWDPPSRVVLAWELDADWKHDPSRASGHSEVEVRFTEEQGGTRVVLEHRLLRQFGARAEELRGIFDSPNGWGGMLDAFAKRADAA